MARSATRKRPAAPAADSGVNPKAPCPCGSGRRYKHCHGSGYAPPVALGTARPAARGAPAGAPVDRVPLGGGGSAGPRLQELVDTTAPFEVTVHEDFGFWLEGVEAGAAARAGLEQANAAILPTELLPDLGAAYWVRPGAERAHLRWVRPEPEEQLLDAL